MPTYKKRFFTTSEILKLTNLSRTILMGLKSSEQLKAGIHYVYLGGKPRSNIGWDLEAIELWMRQSAIEAQNAPYKAAKKIETFVEMGVNDGPTI